ncbi:hypothetical protein Ancab_016894 [Ancistrocladus abbreviatus]
MVISVPQLRTLAFSYLTYVSFRLLSPIDLRNLDFKQVVTTGLRFQGSMLSWSLTDFLKKFFTFPCDIFEETINHDCPPMSKWRIYPELVGSPLSYPCILISVLYLKH